jgi:FG-GAP repeat protein
MERIRPFLAAVSVAVIGAGVSFAAPVDAAPQSPRTTIGSAHSSGASLLASLSDPAGMSNDLFGVSTSLSGKTLLVGAYGTSASRGAAYLYMKGSNGWSTTPSVTFQDPSADPGDRFGGNVALSKSVAVIGASGWGANEGQAYVYLKGPDGWPTTPSLTLQDPIAPTMGYFGRVVAITGKTLVVAGQGDGSPGHVFVYVEGRSGWPSMPTATLDDPAAAPNHVFGDAVAITSTAIAVGAGGDGTGSWAGAAYLYTRQSTGWPTSPSVTLNDPQRTTGDLFGMGGGIALTSNTLIVGARGTDSGSGSAYIYSESSGTWPTTPTQSLVDPDVTANDSFGTVATLGKFLIVGAQGTDSNAGANYVYLNNGTGWPATPNISLFDPAGSSGDLFASGYAGSLSGTTAVLGAYGTNSSAGEAYVYKI